IEEHEETLRRNDEALQSRLIELESVQSQRTERSSSFSGDSQNLNKENQTLKARIKKLIAEHELTIQKNDDALNSSLSELESLAKLTEEQDLTIKELNA